MALQHVKPGEVFSLRPLGNGLADAKTSALVKRDRFEAIRLLVSAGTTIPSHIVSGYVTLYCLEGRLIIDPCAIEQYAGDWVFLDRGAAHSIQGIGNSILHITIFFDKIGNAESRRWMETAAI